MIQGTKKPAGFGSPSNPIRIVVADDHLVVRKGVIAML